MKRIYLVFIVLIAGLTACTDKKSSNPLTANNTAPTLEIVGFASDTLVFVDKKAYTFEFLAKDEVSDSPKVTAKAFGETGTITIVDNTADGRYLGNFIPSGKGRHTIEISVSDGLETTTGNLSVFFGDNQAPKAAILFREVKRDIGNLRFTFEFDASASTDRDSKIIKAMWDLDGEEMEMEADKKFEHTFFYYANYNIGLTVEDEFGGINSTNAIIDNSRPMASFDIRPTNQTTNGSQITLDATASSSPHAAIASYKWFSKHRTQGLNVLTEITSSIYRFDVNMEVGENDMGLIVRDQGGNVSDTTWAKLNVLNQAPQVDFAFSTELERIVITSNTAQDLDPGDVITLNWYLDGEVQADKEDERLPSFNVRGDVYQVTLTATDNHGQSGSTTRSISVPGVPEAHFTFPGGIEDSFETRNGPQLDLDGGESTGGNESRGIETFKWQLRPLGQAIEVLSEGSTRLLQFRVLHPVGEYELGLKIKNLEGLESVTNWKRMTILNSAPIADFTCEFQAFAEGLVYKIVRNDSFDPDPGDSIVYRWFLDGEEQQNTSTATPTFTRSHSSPVTTITLRVVDGQDGVGEQSVTGGCN